MGVREVSDEDEEGEEAGIAPQGWCEPRDGSREARGIPAQPGWKDIPRGSDTGDGQARHGGAGGGP